MIQTKQYLGVLLGALLLFVPLAGQAGPTRHFVDATKAQVKSINTLVKKTRAHRRRNKYQATAARKYSSGFDAVGRSIQNHARRDKDRMHLSMSKYASSSNIQNAIDAFSKRAHALKKIEKRIDTTLKKIKKDKNRWWEHNGKYFDGRNVSRKKLRQLAYWVHVYGTEKGNFLGQKYRTSVKLGKKGSPRSYTGAIEAEKTYLKALKRHVDGVRWIYRRSMAALEARLKQHKRDLAAKKHGKRKVKLFEPSENGM